MNAPRWTKWDNKQIETSIGDMAAVEQSRPAISYSIPEQLESTCRVSPVHHRSRSRSAQATKAKIGRRTRHHLGPVGNSGLKGRLSTTRLEPGVIGPTAWLSLRSAQKFQANRRRSCFSKLHRRTRWTGPFLNSSAVYRVHPSPAMATRSGAQRLWASMTTTRTEAEGRPTPVVEAS